jgi:hypothetical protein
MSQKKLGLMLMALVAAGTSGGCDGTAALEPNGVDQGAQALQVENGLAWNGLAWNGLAYNGLSFNGLTWNGLAWNGLAYNGLSFNGMSYNGLSYNGLSYNGLSYNGLSYNGLSYNGLSYNGLEDPVVNNFVTYLISCALPENDSVTYDIDGKSFTFAGELGLAPEWKFSSCGKSCQRWVTACMLARLNKLGQHVEISLRGEHKALKTDRSERKDFTVREATYYGNLFEGADKIYTCHSPDQANIVRVCGDSLTGCPMNVVGSCDDACKSQGAHKSFRDCATTTPFHKKSADVYEEAITVFLEPN